MKFAFVCLVTALTLSTTSFAATCVATCMIRSSVGGGNSVESAEAATQSLALSAIATQCEAKRVKNEKSYRSITSARLVTTIEYSAMGALKTSFNAKAACL